MTSCCDFIDGACRRCGVRREPPYPVRRCRPGLGDRAASALAAVGVTKERAAAVAKAVGLESCACPARQAWMNRVGYRYFGIGSPENTG